MNSLKNSTANPIFIYFSQLMDKPVIDKNGAEVGTLYDIIIKPAEVYPQSSHLIIRKGFPNRKYAVIPWVDVAEVGEKEILLRTENNKIIFSEIHNNKEELTLRRDILDQQVVDTYNHKVIRINDIHLLLVENHLMAAHADISSKGLFRRLGYLPMIEFFVKLFNPNSEFLKSEHLISWKHIHPLSINPASMTIKVNVPQKQLNNIPAADLGEIFLDLDIKHKIALFKAIDINAKAKIFVSIDFRSQKSLIEDLKTKEIADILNAIPSDEATDFLEKLPKDTVDRFLNLVESKQAKKLSQLLGYSNDSAGGLMTTDYLSFHGDTTIESVLNQIRERLFKVEPVQFVYIIDENNHLIGATSFRLMVMANPQDILQKAAFPKLYFAHLNSTVKEIAYLMDKYKYFAIPVVDDSNVLQGIVTVDDILSQVISIAWRRLTKVKIRPKQ